VVVMAMVGVVVGMVVVIADYEGLWAEATGRGGGGRSEGARVGQGRAGPGRVGTVGLAVGRVERHDRLPAARELRAPPPKKGKSSAHVCPSR
jgi:hypothetical protein